MVVFLQWAKVTTAKPFQGPRNKLEHNVLIGWFVVTQIWRSDSLTCIIYYRFHHTASSAKTSWAISGNIKPIIYRCIVFPSLMNDSNVFNRYFITIISLTTLCLPKSHLPLYPYNHTICSHIIFTKTRTNIVKHLLLILCQRLWSTFTCLIYLSGQAFGWQVSAQLLNCFVNASTLTKRTLVLGLRLGFMTEANLRLTDDIH